MRNLFSIFAAPIQTLWRHRDLLRLFTIRNVEMKHRGSLFGVVWAVLNPLMLLALYVFVFGFVFGGSFETGADESKWDYALGVFIGLTLHHLLVEVIAVAPVLITGSANYVKKVIFPLEILPVSWVGASFVHFAITLTLVAVGVVAVGPGFAITIAYFPLVVLPIVLMAVGLGWLLAAIGVYFRDISQLVQPISLVLLFASGVFYDATQLPPAAWSILKFNPLLLAIDLARDSVLWHGPADVGNLVYINAFGLALCYFGYFVFSRLKAGFADVL